MEPFAKRAQKRHASLAAALAEVIALCGSKPSVLEIYVFGSYALDRVGPYSDLDLLVIRETELPRLARGDDLLLERSSPMPLDLIVLTPLEFADALPQSSFGKTILGTMRRVYAA